VVSNYLDGCRIWFSLGLRQLNYCSDELAFAGTLKMVDKAAFTPDVQSSKYYKVNGWTMKITNVKEDVRTNQSSYTFDGLLGIGIHDGIFNPDMLFKIVGTFQEPAGLLKFTGTETTDDEFFRGRSVE
jgi:hypothetical protein